MVKAGQLDNALAEARKGRWDQSSIRSVFLFLRLNIFYMERFREEQSFYEKYYRARSLSSITEALSQAGRKLETLQIAKEALRSLREPGQYAEVETMLSIADSLLRFGPSESVRGIVTEALTELNGMYHDEDTRSECLAQLAGVLAKMRNYREARETANKCARSRDKLAAYAAILREYHIERNPSLANLFAEMDEKKND